jgi:hypothetical protein
MPQRVIVSDCDNTTVDQLECACEVGHSASKLCVFTDILGGLL